MSNEQINGTGIERWWHLSLATRLILLTCIFLAVPIVLYRLFEAADDDKRTLLLDSVYERGRLTMEVLRNDLEAGGIDALPSIADQLQVLGAQDTVLRLFFRPSDLPEGGREDGFYYVAAAPTRPVEELAREQAEMSRLGVLGRLDAACRDGVPVSARHQLGAAREEVVISVTPLNAPSGCWTLVTAFSTASFRDSSIGRPYWETQEIRLGAVIYLGMFLIMVTVLWSVWRGLKLLTARARLIREQGTAAQSARGFTGLGGPREINEVAEELDRLVKTLDSSANTLREIAHENSHAFKTPVAVIRQAVEPIKRRAEEPRLKRAVEMIELSLEKLDELIASAWRVDELMADLMNPPKHRVDLSSLMERLGRDYATLAQGRRVTVLSTIEPNVEVRGSLDMLEAIIENLVDNAVSFTPSGGRVQIELVTERGMAVMTVADNGPGVPGDRLPRIFDRYFTTRSQGNKGAPGGHLGLGLWIVKRNVDALGGTIAARNRTDGGLKVTLKLPRLNSSLA